MRHASHRLPALVAALLLASSPLAAQLENSAVLTAPTYTSLTFGSGASSRSVSQLALPVVVILPFGERISVDVSTAFASSTVTADDSTASEISGITDTQIRANFRIFADNVLFTVGVNLPTGQYSVPEDQQEAAGQIGNDFLYYPISSMGNGLAMTGGVAYARPLGAWNVGGGASARKSTEFAAFEVASSDFRFTPADEYRVSLNADRPVGDGAVSLGLTYSVFGEDIADTTTYSTGDRIIATAGWNFPVGGNDVFLSAWNLYRLDGEVLGDDAPAENVFNLAAAVSIPLNMMLLQPNVETRLWQVGGARAGNLVTAGLRLRVPVGAFGVFPSVGYSVGNLYSTLDGSGTKVSGLRASVTFRYN
jgi:hypothetical protein